MCTIITSIHMKYNIYLVHFYFIEVVLKLPLIKRLCLIHHITKTWYINVSCELHSVEK